MPYNDITEMIPITFALFQRLKTISHPFSRGENYTYA
jgi:hypothetical protein